MKLDIDKLESARNDAGHLGCRIGDVGYSKDPEIQKCLDKVYEYHELMLDELKEALRLARIKEDERLRHENAEESKALGDA